MSLTRKRASSLPATIGPCCTRSSDDDHTIRNCSSSSKLLAEAARSTAAHSSRRKGNRWARCDGATQTEREMDLDSVHDLFRRRYPGWKYDKDEPALISAANVCNVIPMDLLPIVKLERKQIHAAWGCPTQKNRGEYREKGERSKADIKKILAEAAEEHKIAPNRVSIEYGRGHISLGGKKATITERRKEERCTECKKYGRYCEVVANDDFCTRAICIACLSIRSTCSLKVLEAESLRLPGEHILCDIEIFE